MSRYCYSPEDGTDEGVCPIHGHGAKPDEEDL